MPVQEAIEKDHGRIEIRCYALSRHLDWLDAPSDWAGLQAVGRVESTRLSGNVLRHNGPSRNRIRRRKLRAALNDGYRLTLLLGLSTSAAI